MADVEANLRAKVTVDGAKQGTVELNNLANAGDRAGKKLDLMDKFVGSANKALNYLAVGMEKLNLSYEKGDISLDSYNKKVDKLSNSMSRLQKIARGTSDSFNQFDKTRQTYAQIAGSNTREAAQSNRFNTGNIAAQFQDIAVTSAMNMNPLTIGLQQGTQLAYVLGQSKAPLADFAAGIKNLVSPVTLLSVGLTALVAGLIQMVDWGKVGKVVTEGLSWAFSRLGSNPISNWFKTLIDDSADLWNNLVKLINISESFNDEMRDLQNKKYLLELEINPPSGLTGEGLQEFLYTEKKYGELLDKLDKEKKEFLKTLDTNDLSRDEFDEKYSKYMKEYDEERSLAYGRAQDWAKEKIEVDNLEKSLKNRNKALQDAAKASDVLDKTTQNLTNSYKDLIASGWEKVEDMKFEQSIQGMSEYDQTIEKTTRDLEKQVEAIRQRALAEGVELPILKNYKSEIEEIAQATADTKLQMDMQTESLKLQDEVISFYSSTTKSFFSDMKSGLQEGQSAWEAFGNAVMNVLDKIADKMMDMAVNAIFNGLQTDSAGNKNQGFLGSLISGTMKGVMSAQMPSMNVTGVGNVSGGNVAVTNASYTGPFAKGGAFSNGVYNSPTVFAFANGGKFGVMGEAGPEAVMPLTRRSDGSLGVRADGIGGGSPVVVNVINNSNAQARTQERQTEQGTTIDVMIDEMVAQKLGQTGTASNQALTAFNNRQLIAR